MPRLKPIRLAVCAALFIPSPKGNFYQGNKRDAIVRKVFALSAVSCLLSLMPVGHAMALSFSDGFEGTTIDPFWTVDANYGSVSLSTSQAHSGSQSVMFSSRSGGQRDIHLNHTFSEAMIGSASVWFYDAYPGQQTLYSGILFGNTTAPATQGNAGVMDWDPTSYWAAAVHGSFRTGVGRSLGWHHFEAYFGKDKTEVSIDGVVVNSSLEGRGINYLYLNLSGPSWRPNAQFYFDDFQVNVAPLAAIPEPETYALMLAGLGLLGFAARRRKLKEAAAA